MNPVAASEEHDLASTEYASASEGTSDSEVRQQYHHIRKITYAVQQALRTLILLEQHHKKLGQLLKFQHENPSNAPEPLDAQISESTHKNDQSSIEPPSNDGAQYTSQEPSSGPPRLMTNPSAPARKVSTSIASNLASARGIPPHQQSRRGVTVSPALSTRQADGEIAKQTLGKSGRLKNKNRLENANKQEPAFFSSSEPPPLSEPSIMVPEPVLKPTRTDVPRSESTMAEQTFQQFYTAFETVISKISAPLAFASIPLTGGLTKATAGQSALALETSKRPKPQTWNADVPSLNSSIHTSAGLDEGPMDYSKLISKAALRAVSEDNPSAFGSSHPAESFYVVPTSGGTVSYAGILNRAEKTVYDEPGRAHTRQLSNISEDTIDNFVDAREVPFPSTSTSPEINRDRSSRKQSRKQDPAAGKTVGGKAMEELYLENETLRKALDNLSKRLQMWEVNAQSSSAALQQSLRSLGNQSRGDSPGQMPPYSSINRNDKTVADLEELVGKAEAEKERHRRENEKLKDVVERYRDRWEKLKEGARARKEGQGTPRPKSDAPPDLGYGNDADH